jgi:hypothetical protein
MIEIIVLGILLVLTGIWAIVATRRALKLDNALLDGVEAVEEALDKINEVYGNVGRILQSPLATNDPKVVQIHKELKRVHNSLLIVADRLVSSWNKNEQDEDSEQNND